MKKGGHKQECEGKGGGDKVAREQQQQQQEEKKEQACDMDKRQRWPPARHGYDGSTERV